MSLRDMDQMRTWHFVNRYVKEMERLLPGRRYGKDKFRILTNTLTRLAKAHDELTELGVTGTELMEEWKQMVEITYESAENIGAAYRGDCGPEQLRCAVEDLADLLDSCIKMSSKHASDRERGGEADTGRGQKDPPGGG